MFRKLIGTVDDYALTVARITLGVVFFAHGAQKALGWFGGLGWSATIAGFAQVGIPLPLAILAILAEFLGGIGLLAGLLSRVAALGILTNMLVAVAKVHAANGLFMNWTGKQRGEGFEFHLLAMAIAVMILVRGAGALSLDRLLQLLLGAGASRRDPAAVRHMTPRQRVEMR